MREQLCMLLARYAGQTITKELAVEMVCEIFPDRTPNVSALGVIRYKQYTIQAELVRQTHNEALPLYAAYHGESEMSQSGYEQSLDIDGLIEREWAGMLLQCTARTAEGELVGYMVAYLSSNIQTGTLIASDAAFYVKPSHRGGFLAVRLWQFTEKCAIALGSKEIFCESKLSNKADKMAAYLGYTPVATVHQKIVPIPAQECSTEKEYCHG